METRILVQTLETPTETTGSPSEGTGQICGTFSLRRPPSPHRCLFFRIPLRSVPSRAGGASVSSPPDLRPLPLDVKGSEHSSAPQRRRALPERRRPHLAWSAAALHRLASVLCGMANSTASSTSVASLGSPPAPPAPPPSSRKGRRRHRRKAMEQPRRHRGKAMEQPNSAGALHLSDRNQDPANELCSDILGDLVRIVSCHLKLFRLNCTLSSENM